MVYLYAIWLCETESKIAAEVAAAKKIILIDLWTSEQTYAATFILFFNFFS